MKRRVHLRELLSSYSALSKLTPALFDPQYSLEGFPASIARSHSSLEAFSVRALQTMYSHNPDDSCFDEHHRTHSANTIDAAFPDSSV